MIDADLQAALKHLVDRNAITELVHAYARAADRRDQSTMRALYHDGATDDHGGFFKGLAEDFIKALPQIQAPMQILHHNVTTTNIAIEHDDAEGEIYVLAYHKVATVNDSGASGTLDLLIGGRYLDRYQKRHGLWKFTHRAVLADWATVNDPSVVDLSHPLLQGSYFGKPDHRDPAHEFFKLLGKR
jgi:hypothetical protein